MYVNGSIYWSPYFVSIMKIEKKSKGIQSPKQEAFTCLGALSLSKRNMLF